MKYFCFSEFISKMATKKEARDPRKEKNKKVSFPTKEELIKRYLRTQLVPSIVTSDYVEEYVDIQGEYLLKMRKLFASGKYLFALEYGVLIPIKIENVLSYREFYAIEPRFLKMRTIVQEELARIYQSDGEPFINVVIGDTCAINKNNVWYRGQVLRVVRDVDPEKVRFIVRLLDFGRVVRTKERRLRILKGWLVQLGALAVACTLKTLNDDENDILADQPLEKKIFNQLEKIATDSEKVLIRMASIKQDSNHGYLNEVYLFAVCETDANVSDASYLIHETFGAFNPMKIQFREPICTEWLQKDFKEFPPCRESHFGQKYIVRVMHVGAPSYFYVQMKCQTELVQKIQKKIEQYVSGYDPKAANNEIKWNVGNNCLCLHDRIWYRGQIKRMFKSGKCVIFLRDNGRSIFVRKKRLLRIPSNLSEQANCVQKCHLNVSSEWLEENLDDFRKLLTKYKTFAVSIHSEHDKDTTQSFAVRLFGTNSEPYLENDQAWQNIGAKIITKSIMRSLKYHIEKTQHYYIQRKCLAVSGIRHASERRFDETILLKKSTVSIEAYETLDIQPQKDRITNWVPAVPLEGTTFMASIVHISDEGVFFIQSYIDLHLVRHIDETINAIIGELKDKKNYNAEQWKIGMACFAKSQQNEFPDEYYRATIKSIDWIEKECVVEYVDYGNYEIAKLCDLYVATHFAEKPSLAHPYYLRNVIATSESGKWNPEVLGPCRKEMLGQMFLVMVEHEDYNLKPIVPCHMQFLENHTNLFDWLIFKRCNNGTALNDADELIVNV